MPYDTIIRNGRWYDGTGEPSAVRNIGIPPDTQLQEILRRLPKTIH